MGHRATAEAVTARTVATMPRRRTWRRRLSTCLVAGRTMRFGWNILKSGLVALSLSLAMLLVGGCVLAPKKEATEEKRRVEAAGEPYRSAPGRRALPDLPDEPSWQEVLHRAFLASGELEAAYFEWAAAVH